MKLTLKQMHYFDALARSLHFGKAAASVNISQPALSAQIMDMEAKLDRKLVERRHGKIVLTEAGQRLLPPIRRILRDAQALEEMMLQDRGGSGMELLQSVGQEFIVDGNAQSGLTGSKKAGAPASGRPSSLASQDFFQ